MLVFAFDDDEIWRDEMKEACEARGLEIRIFSDPASVDISEVLFADAVICDNKFAALGYLGADFIRKLHLVGYGGISILYTNHLRTIDQTTLSETSWVIEKDKQSFDEILDSILKAHRNIRGHS